MAKKKQENDSFGERLRNIRTEKGFTQRELAAASGSSQRMIAYYESENGTPAAPVLLKLAEVLEVDAAELIGLDKSRPKRTERAAPQDLRLWRKLKQVEKLPTDQQKTVIKLIDALVEGEDRRKMRG